VQRLVDRDVLTAFVLFCIGAVFWANSGADVKDWIFPLLATYVVLGIAAALAARAIYAAARKHAPDIIRMAPEDRVVFIDVLLFLLIVAVYMLVMFGLGFWLSSFLMLSLASLYLTLEKSRRNIMLAMTVPFASCIVAYFVFLHVFYVPFPKATWWPGLS